MRINIFFFFPEKRTPPGKWQCPNCCGQKEFVNPSRNAEASSRKARTKGIFEKLNHLHRSSSDRVLATGKSSVHDRRFSKKNKATICCRVPSVEKKPDASELDVSCSTKSSNSSDGGSINGNVTPSDDKAQNQTGTSCDLDSNSKKGIHSSVKLLDDAEVSPEAILNEVQAKKSIVRLDTPTERSKKNRRKRKLSKRDKKGILTEKVKLVAQIGSTNASNESSDPEPRALPQKRKSVTQSTPISKEKQKLRKLSNKKRREVDSCLNSFFVVALYF